MDVCLKLFKFREKSEDSQVLRKLFFFFLMTRRLYKAGVYKTGFAFHRLRGSKIIHTFPIEGIFP